MINYEIGELKFSAKSGWHEITFAEYLRIFDAEEHVRVFETIQVLTGLEHQIIVSKFNQLEQWFSLTMGFIFEPLVIPEDDKKVNLSKTEIGRLIDAQKILHSTENVLHAYPMMCSMFDKSNHIPIEYDYEFCKSYSKYFMQENCIKVLTIGKSIVKEYNEFYKMFIEPLNKIRTSEIESASGLDDFMAKWGFYATMHYLCKGDISKFDAFVKEPADKVYTLLNYLKDENEYKNQLQENMKLQSKMS